MLAAFLWILALVAAALLAVALTPVRLNLNAATAPRPRLRVGAAPLGGIVPAIPVYDSARKRKKPEKEDKPEKAASKKGGRAKAGGMSAGAGRAVARLVADLLAQVHFDHLRLEADYGTGDPAETGQICGWLAPLAYGLGDRPGVSVALRPDFARAVLAGELDAAVKITPAALVPPALRFAVALWRPGP
jgi:hypothetical protein